MFQSKSSYMLVLACLLTLAIVGSNYPLISGYDQIQASSSPLNTILMAKYEEHDPIQIISDDDFETQDWPGVGTRNNPYIISGLNITSTDICIDIRNTSSHFIVMSCIISSPPNSNSHGLYLDNVTNGDVRNCIIDSHVEGFLLRDSKDCILTNNTATDNFVVGFCFFTSNNCSLVNNTGIDTGQSGFHFADSSNCTLINNTALGCNRGFNLYKTNNSFLINNTVKDNIQGGFCIDTNSYNSTLTNNLAINSNNGFAIYVDNCTLSNNTAMDNSYTGFILSHANNCTLIYNNATSNTLAFKLHYSSENRIYGNKIAFNGETATDDGGVDNEWDNNISSGNHWDDYDGSGVYNISGSSGSVDRYPFILDLVPPIIDSPEDLSYAEGTTNNMIIWTPSDDHPISYVVYRNGTDLVSDEWNGSQIVVNVDGLVFGIYNYTLLVTDVGGNIARDEVLVTVLDETPPSIDTPTNIKYNLFSTGHSIAWHAFDLHPQSYIIYINGTLERSGNWNSSSEVFTISVDGHEIGTFNYTLEVMDIGSNTAADEVMVTVVDDNTSPTIDSPSDIEYEESTTGYSITWAPSDLHPANYTIYLNGSLLKSGAWNSSSEVIMISVDGLSRGTYNYTLVVMDIGGNTATDSVMVTVTEVTTTTTTTTTITTTTTETTTSTTTTTTPTTTPTGIDTGLLIVIGGGVGLVIILIGIIVLKRK